MTAARAILAHAEGVYKATVWVDALQDAHVHWVGTELRRLGVTVRKVRGVKKDETDALIRLADALCGLTRASTTKADVTSLLKKAEQDGIIKPL